MKSTALRECNDPAAAASSLEIALLSSATCRYHCDRFDHAYAGVGYWLRQLRGFTSKDSAESGRYHTTPPGLGVRDNRSCSGNRPYRSFGFCFSRSDLAFDLNILR